MANEKERRKETFDEANSVWIVLADGQQWAFPKPWLQIHTSFQGGRAISTFPKLTVGLELDALIEAIGECHDNASILCASATLASHLLLRNYDSLDDEVLDTLFAFRVADPDSWNWAREVMDVATGQSGSRSFRGGGDSA